ncbi:MAG TPA: malto-oligosyltrehalose synthase [Kofleriaceae bacterium]|nr:malto-oligosyltrehalose synthase [Kofleriaceae bacterium]
MAVPTSTYRLQLQALGFAAAAELGEYLRELGISDCYASPVLAAAAGSSHGYDVVDHGRVDPALGGEDGLIAFATRLRELGLGLVLDIVPNHMCITSPLNEWWADVLENGPSSPFARYFDIDWAPPKAELAARVLLPILGDQYGRVLERGEIVVRYEGDTFVAAYGDLRLPIAPRTWRYVLEPMLGSLRAARGEQDLHVLELESILTSLEHLPLRTETDRARVRERRREKEIVKRRFAALIAACPDAAGALERALASFEGTELPHVDRLEALLADQGYRPSFWRVASDEINYRRFFDINELAAIRVEEPAVMRAVHAIPLRLMKQGLVTGLRIDHVDGLLAPRQYLQDLSRALAAANAAAPGYLVVEKILGPDERLPRDWPVHGTTGYEVAALIAGVLVSSPGVAALDEVYQGFTGRRDAASDVAYASKKLVLKSAMSSELTVLARKLDDISEQHRSTRDFTLNSLQEALRELVACFPVYRTYIEPADGAVGDDDRRHVEQAIEEAKRRNPATSGSIYDFVADLLLLRHPPGLDAAQLAARRDFVLRFQQLTSPVMAKGLEDTASYRHYPLTALIEVGGHGAPIELAGFHAACARRAAELPHGLSATSTHDTKRGEDVRARLCVLSELPAQWRAAAVRLSELAMPCREARDVPDANELYLLFQTLVGAWPAGMEDPDPDFVARIQQYMNKALKEAKLHTSWINPNERRDQAVARFIAQVLDPGTGAAFLAELAALRRELERPGFFTSLAQLVLKIGIPGVPDFYQGSELWEQSLVDPDNRRPVDFALRRRLQGELRRDGEADPAGCADRLRARLEDGRLKMFVTMQALRFRGRRRELFARGGYAAVAAAGVHRDRVIAFARAHEGARAIVACGRHFTAIAAPPHDPVGARWEDTALDLDEGGRFREVLTGRTLEGRALPLREVFAHLPVAILEAIP